MIGTGKGYKFFGNDNINHIMIILEIYFTDQKNYGGIREIEKTIIPKSLSSSANNIITNLIDIFSKRPKSCRKESGREGKLLEDFVDVGDFKIPKTNKNNFIS